MENDTLTWDEVRKGNKEALSKLFIDEYDDLFRFAKKFEKDKDACKDLIQELFLKIWNSHQKLGETENIKAYLFKSLRNIWINKNKIEQRKVDSDRIDNNQFLYQKEDFSLDSEFEENQKQELLIELNQLPTQQREAIYLKYFHGYDNEEIAEILGINNQSVRNNLYRALTKLREKMPLSILLSL